jgi:hypothetical protein
MPTYADTPKWKSRDAYLDSTPAPKKVKTNPLAVECPTCKALGAVGETDDRPQPAHDHSNGTEFH